MNYGALVSAIEDTTENRDSVFGANMDMFIKQAEERIYNSVKIPALRKSMNGVTAAGNRYLSLPTDYLASFSLAVVNGGEYSFLLNKDISFIREAYPSPTQVSLPAYYSQFDDNTFLLAPTPDANYVVELNYYFYPESIVTAGNTWLGDNFESVLLYGCLVEAYTFMKGEEDMMQHYKTRYNEALLLLKQLGEGFNQRDSYRAGEPSIARK